MENGDEIDVVIEQFGGWIDIYEVYFSSSLTFGL
jgi:hypothetical protein